MQIRPCLLTEVEPQRFFVECNMLSSAAYRNRVGSLLEAYARTGFGPQHDYQFIQVNRQIRSLHSTLVDDTIRQLQAAGATVAGEVTVTNGTLLDAERRQRAWRFYLETVYVQKRFLAPTPRPAGCRTSR